MFLQIRRARIISKNAGNEKETDKIQGKKEVEIRIQVKKEKETWNTVQVNRKKEVQIRN